MDLRDLQVGDDGTMYKGVCQRRAVRALRVGEVVSGCVCMTCQHSAGGVYSSLIDGISNKIKKFPLSCLWSSPIAKVGNLVMVERIRATCALVMALERDYETKSVVGGGVNRALRIIINIAPL
jgi:hypothetical protein